MSWERVSVKIRASHTRICSLYVLEHRFHLIGEIVELGFICEWWRSIWLSERVKIRALAEPAKPCTLRRIAES
jgi:hypothetical protein